MEHAFLKVIFSDIVRVATFPFRILRIRKDRILFTGLTGGNNYEYSCNPKYLYEYMRDNYPGQFQYVWAVSDKKKYAFLEEEGVKLVKHFTVSSFPMLLSAGVVVTNGSYAPWFPFRRRQYVINTWHGGGAYKKVENGKPDAGRATRKRAEFCAKNIDLFLASCKMQEDTMIRKTYMYKGEVLREGTPRNDRLVNGDTAEMREAVRKAYNIPGNGKIVLYAPTYRNTDAAVTLDGDYLLESLDAQSDEDVKWYFMCRYHRYQDEGSNLRVKGSNITDVCDYPDMQHLLAAADILITDYSSCVWDYAFLNRPCFLFVPDKDEYVRETGFYVSVDEWPFPQAEDTEKLADLIREYDSDKANALTREHLRKMGSYEKGQCCKCIAKKIESRRQQ